MKDLEDTALLIEGISTDRISDAVCNIIRAPLIKYTQEMCIYYGIPLTSNVYSGKMWDPLNEKWKDSYVDLPMTDFGKVILVPKIIVRQDIMYKHDKYYRDYLLPAMQEEYLQSYSSLVQVLKNGKRVVTKKDLMAKYGANKLAVVEQTLKRPHVLEAYRIEQQTNTSDPITNEEFSKIEEIEFQNLKELVAQLENLPTGRKFAEGYEDIIEKILSVIFYPSLCNPKKQHEIHDGRKRIDITYINEGKDGFFAWIAYHYPCSLVFVECKNYGNDISNPEIDQLAGRFSPSRGKVGLQIFRTITNKDLLLQRCIDTAKDQRGYIIPIDDSDIKELVNEYLSTDGKQNFNLLRNRFLKLIE